MIGSLAVMASAALLQQPSCDALKTLSLPHVTITAANSLRPERARRDEVAGVDRRRRCPRTAGSRQR